MLVNDFCVLLLLAILPVTSVTPLLFLLEISFTENIPTNHLPWYTVSRLVSFDKCPGTALVKVCPIGIG